MATTKSKRKGMAPIRSIGCILKVNAAFLYQSVVKSRAEGQFIYFQSFR